MFIGSHVKSVLNKKKHRDSWFLDDYTLNLYKGCSFNCLFCYVKGSVYGEHNERSMHYKLNALEILEKELALRARKKQFGFIVMSSSTEPWSQAEAELKLTQKALKLIAKYRFPLHVVTRSDLIFRDWDLLREVEENAIVPDDLKSQLKGLIISFSFNTLDDSIAKIFEPAATPPSIRLDIFQRFALAGFTTGISLMPLLPYISDKGKDLDDYYRIFKASGAKYLMPSTLTLFGGERGDSKTQIFRAVEKHFPELLPKYKKFFDKSDYMPKYYNDAFMKKNAELSLKYKLPNRIFIDNRQ